MHLARVSGRCSGVLIGRADGQWGRSCALGLLVFLLALVPLADASPVDPLWIGGMYDAGDLDEVVVAVVSATAVVERNVLARVNAARIVAGPVPPPDAAVVRAAPLSTSPIRAPPVLKLSAAA
jgi:hypothetical protein